ncbi:MAG: DUF1015 family protein [Acidobacteriota bacterium]|nr:DUF1015 family protein [Acidobacteriota bacterium]
MSLIKPFRALRPATGLEAQVASVPYDVVSRQEAKRLAFESPHSFLRITRAEIDLPEMTDVYAPEVYERAKENLEQFINRGALVEETNPCLYVYRLVVGAHTQTGVVACCSLDEYDHNLIKKHEKTRPDKENDRTRHIVETRAQTGLVFLCYRGTEKINQLVSRVTTTAPLYEFLAQDGVEHIVWRVEQTADLVAAFAEIPALYIADGHHRVASANRARQILKEKSAGADGGYDFFPAAMFPVGELKILAYNRTVKDLNGLSDEEFLDQVRQSFIVSETSVHVPERRGEFCLFLSGKWYKLIFNVQFLREPNPVDALDVSVLQDFLLAPILGIKDARTDERIQFIGGVRGTRELEKLVNKGEARAAFSLFPTAIEDLLRISDADEIMPPKSTWFEPKLRDGLMVHLI